MDRPLPIPGLVGDEPPPAAFQARPCGGPAAGITAANGTGQL